MVQVLGLVCTCCNVLIKHWHSHGLKHCLIKDLLIVEWSWLLEATCRSHHNFLNEFLFTFSSKTFNDNFFSILICPAGDITYITMTKTIWSEIGMGVVFNVS